MTDGWRCPGCGRCYGPFVPLCWYCGPEVSVSTGTGFVVLPCQHEYGEPTTAGRVCRKCGHNEGMNP